MPTFAPTLSRRRFLGLAAAACALPALAQEGGIHFNVAEFERARTLAAAEAALQRQPLTLSSLPRTNSAVAANAYQSEDPEYFEAEGLPKAPWERREGYTNPAAFTAHRDAVNDLNGTVSSLVAAWRLTGEARFANHALVHLRAWFVDPATRMEPQLEFAGAVRNGDAGTPRGVEDTCALAEVVRAASFLCVANGPAEDDTATALREWFGSFATWLNESKKGGIARDAKDRLAICWTLQAAECARFARRGGLLLECSHRFRDRLLRQMNFDGQFPLELHRADAFAASIFTLDCMSLTCEVLSTPFDRLWDYNLPDGRGMRSAVAFLYPALDNRARWAFRADVQHFSDLPARQPSLLLAGRAYSRPEYLETWKRLPAEPKWTALLRRFPARQQGLWTVRAPA